MEGGGIVRPQLQCRLCVSRSARAGIAGPAGGSRREPGVRLEEDFEHVQELS